MRGAKLRGQVAGGGGASAWGGVAVLGAGEC